MSSGILRTTDAPVPPVFRELLPISDPAPNCESDRVMENTFVIAWRSKSEPRWGQGKKLLTRDEAAALAEELNREHPAFIHEALNLAAPAAVTPPAEATPSSIVEVDFQPALQATEMAPGETREALVV